MKTNARPRATAPGEFSNPPRIERWSVCDKQASTTDGADVKSAWLRADDIRWKLEPLEHFDDVDLLALPDDELLTYAYGLQVDRRALRELLHASLTMNRDLRSQLDRALRIIRAMRPARRDRS